MLNLGLLPRSAGCSSCRIIVKFGMKVDYGKTTMLIVFGVGGVIVAMVTIYIAEVILSRIATLYNISVTKFIHMGDG